MGFTNSPLATYTKISPNKTKNRTHSIDRITPHCVVGQVTVEALGDLFAKSSRGASSNYGIGKDGKIALYVEEKDRSWCSSNASNDHRAVTIEVASDTYDPYAITDTAYEALVDLCEDICKRNDKDTLLWFGDKNKTLNYTPKANEMVITVHRWFAAKACPGDYIYNRLGQIAQEVTKRLNKTVEDDEEMTQEKFEEMMAVYMEKRAKDKVSDWAEESMKKAKAAGVTDAERPRSWCTRDEVVTMLDRAGCLK